MTDSGLTIWPAPVLREYAKVGASNDSARTEAIIKMYKREVIPQRAENQHEHGCGGLDVPPGYPGAVDIAAPVSIALCVQSGRRRRIVPRVVV